MIDKEVLKANLKEFAETVVFVVIALIIIRTFIAELRYIPSGSMLPTLVGSESVWSADRIVVEKITKDINLLTKGSFYNEPKRGEIMIFYPPFVELKNTPWKVFSRLTGLMCRDVAYIKRVIGLPGEKFEIKQSSNGAYHVYINDKRLEEDYIMSEYDYPKCKDNMYCGPFIIPEGHYFMMGDNRGSSLDSRFWGVLPKERFIGRAVCVFWPFNHIKILN